MAFALVTLVAARSGLRQLKLGVPASLFLMWISASTMWSAAPSLTLQAATLTALTAVGVGTCVAELGPRLSLTVLARTAKGLLLASLALYAFWPTFAREDGDLYGGTLKGVFIDRNTAAFAFVVFFVALAVDGLAIRRNSGVYGWLLVALVAVLLTGSGTGLAMVALAAVLLMLAAGLRGPDGKIKAIRLALILPSLTFAFIWLGNNLVNVSPLIGRDSTLTGRTVIWMVVRPFLEPVYWEGYGWGALWRSGVDVTDRLWGVANFEFYHAHNGFLEIRLQAGMVGLILLLVTMGASAARSLKHSARGAGPEARFVLAAVPVLFFYGLTEVSFAGSLGLFVVLFAAAIAAARPS